jgi:hypothetical protein
VHPSSDEPPKLPAAGTATRTAVLDTDRGSITCVPIETRIDRDLYLRVFQLREGRWHRCKTWLSHQLFF